MAKPASHRRRSLFAALAALLTLFFALLLAPRAALAAGSVSFTNTSPQETSTGRWKLKMKIGVGAAPDLAHVPFLFVFTQTVLFERALEDKTGEKPILNRKNLVNQSPINESIDVDFESGGKIYPTTNFDFEIRRDRGYEAGEYSLVVKRESDGVQIGQKVTIKLQGENKVVDRRAIVFAGDKKKKVDPDAPKDGDKKDGDKKDDDKKVGDKPAEAAPDGPAAGEPAAAPPEGEGATVPAVEPKQGGCGCRAAGAPGSSGALPLLGLAFALAALRRRSRRR